MNDEFAARRVTREVLAHLERRRAEISGDEAAVRGELDRAFEPLRDAYRESALPPAYFAALEQELAAYYAQQQNAEAILAERTARAKGSRSATRRCAAAADARWSSSRWRRRWRGSPSC